MHGGDISAEHAFLPLLLDIEKSRPTLASGRNEVFPIGGEGNGGVIYPAVHPGRDALTGIGLILEALATSGETISQRVSRYPHYEIIKDKIPTRQLDWGTLIPRLKNQLGTETYDTTDGVKFLGPDFWVHLRPSNTEPIIRISAEAQNGEKAKGYIEKTKMILGE